MKYTCLLLLLPALVCGTSFVKNDNMDPKELCPLIEFLGQKICQSHQNDYEFDPKELCPLIELFDKKVCKNTQRLSNFDPKELCPLIQFIDQKFCQSSHRFGGFDPKELCPLIELFDDKFCQSQNQVHVAHNYCNGACDTNIDCSSQCFCYTKTGYCRSKK